MQPQLATVFDDAGKSGHREIFAEPDPIKPKRLSRFGRHDGALLFSIKQVESLLHVGEICSEPF